MSSKAIKQWLASRPPIQGDLIIDPVDPRHIGMVIATRPQGKGVIEWENGWISEDVTLAKLRRFSEIA